MIEKLHIVPDVAVQLAFTQNEHMIVYANDLPPESVPLVELDSGQVRRQVYPVRHLPHAPDVETIDDAVLAQTARRLPDA